MSSISRLLIINAQKLEYDDKEQVRVLLAVADVTEARASEKLKDKIPKMARFFRETVQRDVRKSRTYWSIPTKSSVGREREDVKE
jgi:hypothetical protein